MATLRRRPKPDAEKMYEPLQPFSSSLGVFNPGQQLRGDHPAVRAQFGMFMLADLPSNEKGRLKAEAMWGLVVAEGQAASAAQPPPDAPPPAAQMRANGTWTIPDKDLGGPRRLRAGQVVSSSDPIYVRYPHLFSALVEER